MLRNLLATTQSGSGILGTYLVGVLASDMPSGYALPGLLNNDVDVADPAGTLYRVEIVTWPSAGTLSVDENGAFSFAGAPDGTYTGTEHVYKYDPSSGLIAASSYDTTYSLSIGNAAPMLSATISSASSVTATLTVPSAAAQLQATLSAKSSVTASLTTAQPTPMFIPSTARTINVQATSPMFSGSKWWNLTDTKKPRGAKDPDATIDITFNWSDWLNDIGSVTISSVSFTVNGVSSVGTFSDGINATVFVSGGTNNTAATVACRVTTNTSPPRVDERTIYLDIGDE